MLKKNINFLSIFTICLVVGFILYYSQILDYGLPYFLNADEAASLKSTLYYYGFFSGANQNIIEPIYGPFFNFLISGFLLILENIFILNFSFSDLSSFVYFNPDILINKIRFASLITSAFSLFLIYLILKKLKIDKIISSIVLLSIATSYFFFDLSIVIGKNSYLLFFFLIQYYFFLKYITKIHKFNFESYILFAIIASIGWGINYWCATPGIYSILILHFLKYKFTKINRLLIFGIIFFIFGILANFLISSDNIFSHFYNPNFLEVYYETTNRFKVFFIDLKESLDIFLIFEKTILILLIISIFFLKNLNITQKKIFFSTLFFSIEPAILFALADYSDTQLRYFGTSITLIHILIALMISNIIKKSSKLKKNSILIIFVLIFATSISYKISDINTSKKIISKTYNQYNPINDFKNNDRTLFFFTNMIKRENIKSLDFYRQLINEGIIVLNPAADGKNDLSQIKHKKEMYKNVTNPKVLPINHNFSNLGGEFLIQNNDKFIFEIKKNFDFVVVEKDALQYRKLLANEFEVFKVYDSDNLKFARNLTTRLRNYKEIKHLKFVGPKILVYKKIKSQ